MTRMRIGKKKSTREEIGARNIDGVGVETYGNEYLVYFLVQPDNIAVLSETAEMCIRDSKCSEIIEISKRYPFRNCPIVSLR